MNRADLSPWGAELPAEEFPPALAALGALTAAGRVLPHNEDLLGVALQVQRQLLNQGSGLTEWGAGQWSSWPSPLTLPQAQIFAESWRRAVQNIEERPRLEIVRPPPQLDLLWVARQLSMPVVGARSVYVADEWLSADAEWNWPLRVGLVTDDTSQRLREELERDHWHNQLFDLAYDTGDEDELDLLLAQGDAAEALQGVLGSRVPVKANCVALFRRRGDTWETARPMLEALATEVGASGVVISPMARRDQAPWFHELIRALSHDEPLDVALLTASQEAKTQPPLLVANRALVLAATISVHAERIIDCALAAGSAETPLSVPPGWPQRSAWHRVHRPQQRWQRGCGRRSTRPGTSTRAMPRPPSPTSLGRLSRSWWFRGTATSAGCWRRCTTCPPSRNPARLLKPASVFRSGALHNVDVWIGPWQAGALAAGTPFPEDLLPPSPGGHWLTVVMTEPTSSPEAQVRRLRLPPAGPSSKCRFVLHPPSETQNVEARISVLYRNRILQTALLRGPVISDPAQAPPSARISIEVGAIIRPSIGDLAGRQRFDAALVFNTLPDSTPAVTEVAGLHADFRQLEGIDELARRMRQELTNAAKSPDRYDAFDTPASLILLRTLANQGASLRDALIGQLPAEEQPVGEQLAQARRIQNPCGETGTGGPGRARVRPAGSFRDGTAVPELPRSGRGGRVRRRLPGSR